MNAKRAAEGINLIAIGGVLLANTFGTLPWAVWISIISLWPIALIAAGVDIIGTSAKQTWLRILSSLIMLAALLYGALVMVPGTWGFPFRIANPGPGRQVEAKEVRSGITSGTATVKIGATKFTLGAGSDLAALMGKSPNGLEPRLTSSASGAKADVLVEYQRPGQLVFFGDQSSNAIDLSLDRAVQWERIELDAGAVDAKLDLSGLTVGDVVANVGAASVEIVFPRASTTKAEVNGGMCNIILRVPDDADVTVKVQGLPVNVDVPAGFESSGTFGDRTWTHAGTGSGTVDVSVDGGMANVEVRTY